jgi:hypothetical protein
MSDLENNPTLLLNLHLQKIAHIENTTIDIIDALNNIQKANQDFTSGYKKNNIYGLIKTSELFYKNCSQFIDLSKYLFKNHLKYISVEDAKTIIENMEALVIGMDNLKSSRNNWLSASTLPKDPHFLAVIQDGDIRFNILEEKAKDFLITVSNKCQVEEDRKNKIKI